MRLLRGLGSHRLDCGCLAGIYETYAGTTVSILDARGEHCTFATHHPGEKVEQTDLDRLASTASRQPRTSIHHN